MGKYFKNRKEKNNYIKSLSTEMREFYGDYTKYKLPGKFAELDCAFYWEKVGIAVLEKWQKEQRREERKARREDRRKIRRLTKEFYGELRDKNPAAIASVMGQQKAEANIRAKEIVMAERAQRLEERKNNLPTLETVVAKYTPEEKDALETIKNLERSKAEFEEQIAEFENLVETDKKMQLTVEELLASEITDETEDDLLTQEQYKEFEEETEEDDEEENNNADKEHCPTV